MGRNLYYLYLGPGLETHSDEDDESAWDPIDLHVVMGQLASTKIFYETEIITVTIMHIITVTNMHPIFEATLFLDHVNVGHERRNQLVFVDVKPMSELAVLLDKGVECFLKASLAKLHTFCHKRLLGCLLGPVFATRARVTHLF